MLQQNTTPIVVQVIDEPTPEMTVADVLLQAIGLAGAFVIATLLIGLLAGGAFFYWRRSRSEGLATGGPGDLLRLDLSPPDVPGGRLTGGPDEP